MNIIKYRRKIMKKIIIPILIGLSVASIVSSTNQTNQSDNLNDSKVLLELGEYFMKQSIDEAPKQNALKAMTTTDISQHKTVFLLSRNNGLFYRITQKTC